MWISITPDDLAGLASAEIAKLTQINGGVDKLPGFIDQVVGEVRGYVGTSNPLGAVGTIPDELKDAAVNLIIWRYVNSVPSKSLVTDARKNAADEARTLLRDVASGKFRVVAPVITAPQQVARPGVMTVQAGNSGNSREDLSRL